jgi:hypothetical protein
VLHDPGLWIDRIPKGRSLSFPNRESCIDEPSPIWFRTECRGCLRSGRGTAFQDLLADLMELAYPRDFRRIRPYGNRGDQQCDG